MATSSITPSFLFFNDTATTEIYTLSLHDALPISLPGHEDVHDHDIGGATLVRANPCVAVRGLSHFMAGVLQMLRQGLAERDVVVDDQESGHVTRLVPSPTAARRSPCALRARRACAACRRAPA